MVCPGCDAELIAEPWRGSHLLLTACCGNLVQVNPGGGYLCVEGVELMLVNESYVEGSQAYERARFESA